VTSPTQRSKAALVADGWTVATVERWNPHMRIRQDLFGFADLLAMKPVEYPLLVQVTSTGWSSRIKKIRASDLAFTALNSGFRIEVHGWRKLLIKRGGKAVRWTPKIVPITQEDFPCPSQPSAPSQGARP